ncbi:hypothetical protein ACO0SA_001566 [Hanseniaspora valbyensis]
MNSFSIDKYDIQLVIDPKENSFKGLATLFFDKTPLADITLHSHGLKYDQYNFNGDAEASEKNKPAVINKTDRTVSFPIKSFEKEIKSITIAYSGPIELITKPNMKTQGIFKTNLLGNDDNEQSFFVATNCQPFASMKVFPCLLTDNNKAKFELSLMYPNKKDFKSCSNTEIISQSIIEDQCLVKFKETTVMSPSLFGFALGKMEFLETFVDIGSEEMGTKQEKLPIRVYSPYDIQSAAFALDIAKESIQKLSNEFFGDSFQFPLNKIDFVAMPFLHCGATENFGMIAINAQNILLSKYEKAAYKQLQIVIAHELVHQWVGDMLSFGDEYVWFNESFATYAATKVIFPEDAEYYDSILDSLYDFKIQDHAEPMNNLDASSFELMEQESYMKGVLIIRYISEAIGLKKIVEAIKNLVDTNEKKYIKPEDIFAKVGCLDLYKLLKNGTKERIILHLNEESVEISPKINIPIFLNDSEVLNSTDLTLAKIENFTSFKKGNYGMYRVHYNNKKIINNLVNNLEQTPEFDIINILDDLKVFIEDYKLTNIKTGKNDLLLPILMLSKIKEIVKSTFTSKYNEILISLLSIIQLIVKNLKDHDVTDITTLFGVPLQNDLIQLFKIFQAQCFEDSKFKFAELDPTNYTVLSQLLPIILNVPEVDEFVGDIMKSWVSGRPITSKLPLELIYPTLMAHVSKIKNIKEWKKVYQMYLKTENYMSGIDTSNVSGIDFSVYVFASFAEVSEEIFLERITDHILDQFYTVDMTSKISSFYTNGNKKLGDSEVTQKDFLWSFYKKHFDQFVTDMRMNKKKWTEIASNNFIELSQCTFSLFNGSSDINEVEQFIALKEMKFGKSMIPEILDLRKKMNNKKDEIYGAYLSDKYNL